MAGELVGYDGGTQNTLAASVKEQTPLQTETIRQEKAISMLTEAVYSLKDKLNPMIGSVAENQNERTARDSSGSSEFLRVFSDNNDRLEFLAENINSLKWALEI